MYGIVDAFNIVPAGDVVRSGCERGVHAPRRAERGFRGAVARTATIFPGEREEARLLSGLGADLARSTFPRRSRKSPATLCCAGIHRQDLDDVGVPLTCPIRHQHSLSNMWNATSAVYQLALAIP